MIDGIFMPAFLISIYFILHQSIQQAKIFLKYYQMLTVTDHFLKDSLLTVT
jgi:hypothetical protein